LSKIDVFSSINESGLFTSMADPYLEHFMESQEIPHIKKYKYTHSLIHEEKREVKVNAR